MEYAEAAQREGLRDLQPRPERRPPLPGMYMPPAPPTFRDTSLAEVFSTLSRCVRQAILLEARLDAGGFDQLPPVLAAPAAPAAKKSVPSPARAPGDGTRLDYERLEDDLAADDRRPADDILIEICQNLGQAIEKTQAAVPASPAPTAAPRQTVPPPAPNHPPRPSRPPDKPPPKPG